MRQKVIRSEVTEEILNVWQNFIDTVNKRGSSYSESGKIESEVAQKEFT